jgi:hypothetical protein
VRIPSLSPIAVKTALELGTKNVFPTADLVNQAGNGGCRHDRCDQHSVEIPIRGAPSWIGAGSSLRAFRTAIPMLFGRMRAGAASRSDSCAAWAMTFRAIDLVSSGRVNERAPVTHRENLNAEPKDLRRLSEGAPIPMDGAGTGRSDLTAAATQQCTNFTSRVVVSYRKNRAS